MLTFKSIKQFKPGDLAKIIYVSYSDLIKSDPDRWNQEKRKWDDFDKQAFGIPAIGKCLFVTYLDGDPIGLASYDPRQWPEVGIIGQNCILPEFRGNGYGVRQIEKILDIFRKNKVKKARVTTSEHPFFISAQKMYKSLGFTETGTKQGGPDPKYKIIYFELALKS